MYFRNELLRIREGMSDRLTDLEEELELLPDGLLYIYTKRGYDHYCQRFPATGNAKKEHRFDISEDDEMIFALARKKFIMLSCDRIEADITQLDAMLERYKPCDEESVMQEDLEKYPRIRPGVFINKRDQARWMEEFEQNESFYPEDLKSLSLDGTKMRSDGELYIAARLSHFGLPYRYEAETGIPDLSGVPDFTIIRPRDRKLMYWEHFGMVGDPEYVDRNIYKVSKYIDYGIKPWDNFIMSFNQEGGGFNAKLIDSLIEGWLL